MFGGTQLDFNFDDDSKSSKYEKVIKQLEELHSVTPGKAEKQLSGSGEEKQHNSKQIAETGNDINYILKNNNKKTQQKNPQRHKKTTTKKQQQQQQNNKNNNNKSPPNKNQNKQQQQQQRNETTHNPTNKTTTNKQTTENTLNLHMYLYSTLVLKCKNSTLREVCASCFLLEPSLVWHKRPHSDSNRSA